LQLIMTRLGRQFRNRTSIFDDVNGTIEVSLVDVGRMKQIF